MQELVYHLHAMTQKLWIAMINQYCAYYHHDRIHQSLGRTIEPKHQIDGNAEIQYIERLGGLLKPYHRLAA